jgi:hypothetical protein
VPRSYVPDGATKLKTFWFYKAVFAPITSLCNWNFRSLVWDNNVMGLHGSYCRLFSYEFIIREVLSSSVFFPQVIDLA